MYWYIAKENELLIDLDHRRRININRLAGAILRGDNEEANRLRNSSIPTKLINALARLKGAISEDKITVEAAYLFPSDSILHYHLVVVLARQEPILYRLAWENYLRDDPYRVQNNMIRGNLGITGSLLITSESYRGFRHPDYKCKCRSKHNRETMERCEVAKLVRDTHRHADYFGKPVTLKTVIDSFNQKMPFGKLDLSEV